MSLFSHENSFALAVGILIVTCIVIGLVVGLLISRMFWVF
jgi:type III secretory pathway component EscT